jgi:DNA polymerase-3 subunit chi
MRVGFYLAPDQPVERVLPQIAKKAVEAGERMLVVAEDSALLDRIGKALWELPEDFLANGRADAPQAERQPLLLSESCGPVNGAKLVALADGRWREEARTFERAFLFFDEAGRAAAREAWRGLDDAQDIEREFWEHDGRKWAKKA